MIVHHGNRACASSLEPGLKVLERHLGRFQLRYNDSASWNSRLCFQPVDSTKLGALLGRLQLRYNESAEHIYQRFHKGAGRLTLLMNVTKIQDYYKAIENPPSMVETFVCTH